MLKPAIVVALVGTLATPTLADHYKSGVAMPRDLLPPVSDEPRFGPEGGDAAVDIAGDYPWGQVEGNLFNVAHRYGREGGEGGEGGKGGERYYDFPRHHHARIDRHVGPPPVAAPCGSNQLLGTLLGAAAGGFLGSKVGKGSGQLAAVAAGTLLGAFIGRDIGASLDRADLACAELAAERAHNAPIGTRISWNNPDNGHSGTITPVREATRRATGQYCREYQQTVTIGGRTEQAYGTACRKPDGSWQVVN